jgi:hypothetical protein
VPTQEWRIHKKENCPSCGVLLKKEDYERCGTSLNDEYKGMFFDYVCHRCQYRGRWVYTDNETDPINMLLRLAKTISQPDGEKDAMVERLNMIHDVNDLLRLNNTNAPGETDDKNQKDRRDPSR